MAMKHLLDTQPCLHDRFRPAFIFQKSDMFSPTTSAAMEKPMALVILLRHIRLIASMNEVLTVVGGALLVS
jgi:hypothetical protein